jgi:hypothetical protein
MNTHGTVKMREVPSYCTVVTPGPETVGDEVGYMLTPSAGSLRIICSSSNLVYLSLARFLRFARISMIFSRDSWDSQEFRWYFREIPEIRKNFDDIFARFPRFARISMIFSRKAILARHTILSNKSCKTLMLTSVSTYLPTYLQNLPPSYYIPNLVRRN